MEALLYRIVIFVSVLSFNCGKSDSNARLKHLHPCVPPSETVGNVTPSIFTTIHPIDVQVREEKLLNKTIISLRDGFRLIKGMQKFIKRALLKKSSRFNKTLNNRKGNAMLILLPNPSSFFKSFVQNLQLDYTTISRIYMHLAKRFRRGNKRWTRKMKKLKKKNLEILCHLNQLIRVEGTELPALPSHRGPGFPKEKYGRKVEEFKRLGYMKSAMSNMIRLYRHYKHHLQGKHGLCV